MNGTRSEEVSEASEQALEALARSVRQLEARVAAIERRISGPEPALPPVPAVAGPSSLVGTAPASPRGVPVQASLLRVGQACLVLCGAFLLRALTDRQSLPLAVGLALGLAYALGWLAVAELCVRRGRPGAADFFGILSAVVAFPLVWESATRFDVVGGGGAAVLIGLVTLPALALAWARDLAPVAWVFSGCTALACFALMFALHSVEPLAVPLLAVGVSTSWIAHERRWLGLHWPVAGAVDLYVLHMALLVGASNPKLQWTRSASAVLALCVGLFVAYLASFAGQTLKRQRRVGAFEIVQTGVVLLVGLGGAARVARVSGSGVGAIAAGALVGGLACYAVAFAATKLRWKRRRNFLFYAWLGFALVLSGSYFLGEGLALVCAWSGLGVGGALLGSRFRRVTLHLHGAGYLVASALVSGLAATALQLFVLPADAEWPSLRPSALVALGTALATYLVLAFTPVDRHRPTGARLPRLAVALVGVAGLGGVLVALAVRALGNAPPGASPGTVAATRTAVLSLGALALAATSRRTGSLELRWIVFGLLLAAGVKLLLEDLRVSSPAALFVEFGVFGLSLIVSQRLLRTGPPGGETRAVP